MKKLTPNQKQYRRRKKLQKRDILVTKTPEGKTTVRVNRKPLCVRVNSVANDRLRHYATLYNCSLQDLLSHTIIKALPMLHSLAPGMNPRKRYCWPDELINVTTAGKRRASSTGIHQLNLLVTSTAWNKLQCYSTFIGYSKRRIVEALIVNYGFSDSVIEVFRPGGLSTPEPSIIDAREPRYRHQHLRKDTVITEE
jgi:hypothetical protein